MYPEEKQFINGRIVGGYSIFDKEYPERCPAGVHTGWRTVDCCGQKEDYDILECSQCGKQVFEPCNFDEEYS